MASAEGDDWATVVTAGSEEVVGEVGSLQPTDLNIQGRLAADPQMAQPTISTASGMPNAMTAHISSVAQRIGPPPADLISL